MLRGRMISRAGPPRASFQDTEEDESPKPVRTSSPIYPRDPSRNWTAVSGESTVKSAKDRLLSVMMDRKYHSIEELNLKFPGGEWAGAMSDLLSQGMTFDRHGSYFKIRLLGIGEQPQLIAVLLDGVEFRPPQIVESQDNQSDDEFPFSEEEANIEEREGWKTDTKDGLVLSDPSDDLQLPPVPSAGMTGAILAKKQSGKTYLGMVLAEEFMSTRAITFPVVIIDPTGVWHGLLATEDGDPSPFGILVMGGEYADLSIASKDGTKAADVVQAIYPTSVLMDVSGLTPIEQHQFVADFAERFYVSASRRPVHIIIDEADEFAPQRSSSSSPHQKRALAALDRLVRRGRAKGIGTTVITQRSAVISKNLISQVDALWLLNMVEHNDLVNVGHWLSKRVTAERRDECVAGIPNLLPGTAYFLKGGMEPMFRRFKVRRKRTYDSSRTPDGSFRGRFLRSHPAPDVVATAKKVFEEEPVDLKSESEEGED